jgi:hypothetical protein
VRCSAALSAISSFDADSAVLVDMLSVGAFHTTRLALADVVLVSNEGCEALLLPRPSGPADHGLAGQLYKSAQREANSVQHHMRDAKLCCVTVKFLCKIKARTYLNFETIVAAQLQASSRARGLLMTSGLLFDKFTVNVTPEKRRNFCA